MKNLYKAVKGLSEFKFDYLNLKKSLPFHIQNCKNRASKTDPTLVLETWNLYMRQLRDVKSLEERYSSHLSLTPKSSEDELQHKKHGTAILQILTEQSNKLKELEFTLISRTWDLPNTTSPSTPVGDTPQVVREKPFVSSKTHKDHLEIGKKYDLFDFEAASQASGSKFVYLKNEAALLELALVRYAMDKVSSLGFMPILTPDISKVEIVGGCGFNPRDEANQLFLIHGEEECLIGTSEITLAGLHAGTVLDQLPSKFAGFSHCFRLEAGRGASAKGLKRMHQFSKVEMFIVCDPKLSEETHEEILQIQESIVNELGLSYRVLNMNSTDLGSSAYKKYDIEVFVPSRGYVEVSSASNCTDFQSLRLNIQSKHGIPHTLNGTALAVPRIIMALLEVGQSEDGINLPSCLEKYLGFSKIK